MKKGQEPAFPAAVEFVDGKMLDCFQSGNHQATYSGISTRLYLAGMAMQGLMARAMIDPTNMPVYNYNRAKFALSMADELLKQEREEPE